MSPERKWITLKIPYLFTKQKLQIKYLSDTQLLHIFFSELESVSSSAAFRANLAQQFQNKNSIQHHTRYGNVSCWHGLCPQRLLVFRARICWRVLHLTSIFLIFMFQIHEGSQICSSCGTRLSEYFCFKCKHFTGVDKNPFHCDKCGICRYVVLVLHFILFYCIYFFSTLTFYLFICFVVCLFACLFVCFLADYVKRIFMSFLGSQIVTRIKQTREKLKPDCRVKTCKLPQTARSRQFNQKQH